MSQSEVEYLRHIEEEMAYLAKIGHETKKERFDRDDTLKRATTRSIEIIGEATKQLSGELRAKYPSVPWRQFAGMRDRLIHGYFSVDYDIVWDVIVNEAPELQSTVEGIIEAETSRAQ